jgi:uncharacterized membrane protein YoaK (UPF0700 family)
MKISLPLLLSFNGGYVDTAGFLALQGLFTAHVTGNFVTAGAALVLGTSGVVGKLLALPVFCAVVVAVRLLGYGLQARRWAPLRALLGVQTVLLAAGGGLAIALGPFADADAGQGLLTGMTLVAAMAVQNALHRMYLSAAPPSTLMTGTTTQVMMDLVDALQGKAEARTHLVRMAASVVAFAVGCGLAALLFVLVGLWVFAVPVAVALVTLFLKEAAAPVA